VQRELEDRLDAWMTEVQRVTHGRELGYRDRKDGVTLGLLQAPGLDRWTSFTCLTSLRDVEPQVGLILDDRSLADESEPTYRDPPGNEQDPEVMA
jgi:hypothetical protein